MINVIKLILIMLLLICLAKMPYAYYQALRFISLIGFGVLAYNANEKLNKIEAITFVLLAALFQPFFKIALGREIWNVVDVFVAIGLLGSIFIKYDKT
jgi:hypothetical protein